MSGDVDVIVCEVGTPAGKFGAVFTDKGLAMLLFPSQDLAHRAAWVRRWKPQARITAGHGDPRVAQLEQELSGYFEGQVRDFGVPLDMHGTPFQLRVWNEVYRVGYAQMRSYREIAQAVGQPAAVRAVGAANGANPIPIIVPCHRIIGSDGKLVGYGGGLDMKRRLLELEGVMFMAG
jgi:O-6-methylguanine DNA methyltransferase